ncbi:hypothetical protein CRENBAI_003006 [Crenichthys baileyi]|uniref:Uncharacterized protein n=1 Tax=Crenichthys baileyi TaxID=28760 RepID=A0AAV9SG39_9TELE
MMLIYSSSERRSAGYDLGNLKAKSTPDPFQNPSWPAWSIVLLKEALLYPPQAVCNYAAT